MSIKVHHFFTPKEIELETIIPAAEIIDDIKSGIVPAVYSEHSGEYHLAGDDVEKYLKLKNITHSITLFHHA